MKWHASISRMIAWLSQADGTVVPVTYATLSLNSAYLRNFQWANCQRLNSTR